MKLNGRMICILATIMLLQVSVVHATKVKVIVKAQNKQEFAAVVAAVHQQMQPGGRYEHVSASEAVNINQRFADMQTLFDRYGTVDKMNQNEKIQLFNDQEFVNAALTKRDNKRLVCEQIAPVGSHIPRTSCRTYGDIMQSQRDTQQVLMKMQQTQPSKGGSD